MIYKREEYIQETQEEGRSAVKQIEVLVPQAEGEQSLRYIGHVTMMIQTPMGAQQMPVSFEIDAANIEEAFQKFDEYAQPRIEETRKAVEQEIQRMRQEASNRIVSPDELGGAGGQGGGNIVDFGNLRGD